MLRRFTNYAALLVVFAAFFATGCVKDSATSVTGDVSDIQTLLDQFGIVSLLMSDAPLEDLVSFEIEVSAITLQGAGIDDWQVFPVDGQSADQSITLDLLSLQGFSQMMATAGVPEGTYWGVEIEYSNPTAIDIAGVAQTVTVQLDDAGAIEPLTGLFSPPLAVADGSSQSVGIELDLSNSVIDLGGSSVFLAPVLIVEIKTEAIPVKRFTALVTSINTTADSFVAEVYNWGAADAEGGAVTVTCNSDTSFNDGDGNISVGSVTATGNLAVGDLVEIDGEIVGGVLAASAVLRVPGTTSGGGIPATGLPPMVEIAGTISAVDTTANQVTIYADSVFGANAGSLQAFSDITVDVDSTTNLHRGPTGLVIADLQPGNYAHVYAEAGTGSAYTAHDIDENPAFVAGVVTAITTGGGTSGGDLIAFTPEIVNQIPVAEFTFMTSLTTLNAEVSSGFSIAAGDRFEIFAFFDGTDTLKLLDFGGHSGAIPSDNAPDADVVLTGEVSAASTAATNTAGDITFEMDLTNFGAPNVLIDVVVDLNAHLVKIDTAGDPTTLTVAEAIVELNASPPKVAVEGVPDRTNDIFDADTALRIFESADTSYDPQDFQSVIGKVDQTVTAAANTDGDIEFTMLLGEFGSDAATAADTMNITVNSAALIEQINENGVVTDLTVTAAIGALNADPDMVEVGGTTAPSGGSFTANLGMRIYSVPAGHFRQGYVIMGDLVEETPVTITSGGDITFELWDYIGVVENDTGIAAITVTSAATLEHVGEFGELTTIDATQLVDVLEALPFMIEVEGTLEADATGAFTADLAVRVFGDPGGNNDDFGNFLGGKVDSSQTAAANSDGDIVFLLEFFGPGAVPITVEVTVDQNARMELISSTGTPSDLTAATSITELNGNPDFVEVLGSAQYNGGSSFSADMGLRVFEEGAGGIPPAGAYIAGHVDTAVAAESTTTGITFQLLTWDPATGQEVSLPVTITSSAVIESYDEGSATETVLTVAEAVTALNADPSMVELASTLDFDGTAFTADDWVGIFNGFAGGPQGNVVVGEMAVGSTASLNATGAIEFSLASRTFDGTEITINALVNSGAEMEVIDMNGFPAPLTPNAAVDALNNLANAFIQLEGTNSLLGMDFTADLALRIFEDDGFTGEWYGGLVNMNTTPAATSTGDVTFGLDTWNDQGTMAALSVTVPAGTPMEFFKSDGGIRNLTADEAATMLAMLPPWIEVEGANAAAGGAFTADNVLRIFEPGGPGGADDFWVGGELTAGTTAALSGTDITFSLEAWGVDPASATPVTITVTVPDTTNIFVMDDFGNTDPASGQTAIDAMNANPFSIDCIGTTAPTTSAFTADIEVWVYASGGGGPNFLWGEIATGSVAATNATGGIDFDMNVVDPWGNAFTISVTVTADARKELLDQNGAPQTLTTSDAVTALNDGPFGVEVGGREPLSGTTFLADEDLIIHKSGGMGGQTFLFGNVTPGSIPTESTTTGVTFSLDIDTPNGTLRTVEVIVPATATIEHYNAASVPDILTSTEAVAVLAAFPAWVECEGSTAYDGSISFTADMALKIYADDGGSTNWMQGIKSPSTSAIQSATGDILFQLDIMDAFGTPTTIDVTLAASATGVVMEVWNDTTGMMDTLVDVTAALAALNSTAPIEVEVEGNAPYDGFGSFTADVALRIWGELPAGWNFLLFGGVSVDTTLAAPALNSLGHIVFNLDTWDAAGSPITVEVTVDANAVFEKYGMNGVETLTSQQAVAALNDNPDDLEVEGTIAFDETLSPLAFYADVRLRIYANFGGGGFLWGQMTPATTASINGTTGDLEFSMDVPDPFGAMRSITASVPSTATLEIDDGSGTPITMVDLNEAMATLNDGTMWDVELESTNPWDGSATHAADLGLRLFMPFTGGFLYGQYDSAGGATIDTAGDLLFTLNTGDPAVSTPMPIAVTVSQNAMIEFFDAGNPPITMTVTEAQARLTAGGGFDIDLEGSTPWDGTATTYTADVSMRIFAWGQGQMEFVFGTVITTAAALDTNGDITFSMEVLDMNAVKVTAQITVSQMADMFYYDASDVETTITATQAIAYLNDTTSPPGFVFCEGLNPLTTTNTFFADGTLEIEANPLPGQVLLGHPDPLSVVMATTDMTFDVMVEDPSIEGVPPGTLVMITTSSATVFSQEDPTGGEVIITAAQAFTLLSDPTRPNFVEVYGTYDSTTFSMTAMEVVIWGN